ncbi:MAG: N-acetylmuramoyl-L-alanine amidase [Rickettsiales bacterium]
MLKINNNFASPSFDLRPEDAIIDTIIIHHTKISNIKEALDSYLDKELKLSAHYLLSKQGEIFSLVEDHLRAWHAGVSYWRGREKINNFSIGIELDNNGEEEFSNELMQALIELCHYLIKKHPIDQFNIIGHSDIAPGRKDDPGNLFNWQLLADNNIGIMPSNVDEVKVPEIRVIQKMLSQYGYKIEITGIKDEQTLEVMKAFNEHFNQKCLREWDERSQGCLEVLIIGCFQAL